MNFASDTAHDMHDHRDFALFRELTKAEKKVVLRTEASMSGDFYYSRGGYWVSRYFELRGHVLVKREKADKKPTHFWDLRHDRRFFEEPYRILKDDPNKTVNSRGPFPGTTSFFNRPSQIIICGPWVHWHLFIPCHGHYLKGQFGAKGLESII